LAASISSAFAQHVPGSWRLVPMSGVLFSQVVDTQDKVYYVTGVDNRGGVLYSYDKVNQETNYYTPGTDVSGTGINKIYYNPDNKYLVITYIDGNVDILHDSGELINMPDIKDSNISYDKGINDVAFDNNKIYMATNFGMVVFDDQKFQVVESGIYGEAFTNIIVLGKRIALYRSTYGKRFFATSPVDIRHKDFSSFTSGSFTMPYGVWVRLNENEAIYAEYNQLRKVYYDPQTDQILNIFIGDKTKTFPGIRNITPYKNGAYFICDEGLVEIDKDYNLTVTPLAEDLEDNQIGMYESTKSIWAADGASNNAADLADPQNRKKAFSKEEAGIGNFDISGGGFKVLSERFHPASSQSFESAYTAYSPDGSSVYLNNIGITRYHGASDTWGQHHGVMLEKYDWATGEFTQLYPLGTKNINSSPAAEYNKFKTGIYYGGSGRFAVDPIDPDIIYMPNYQDGLVILKDRKILHNFYQTNSPFNSAGDSRVFDAQFDNLGNLWVGYWATSDKNGRAYFILTADKLTKLRNNPSSIVTSDWLQAKWPSDLDGEYQMRILFSTIKNKNKALHVNAKYQHFIVGYDTNGTTAVTDDKSVKYTGFLDQDGTVTNPMYKTAIVEDKNGDFWIGSTEGVYVLKDFDQICNSAQLSVMRPKVARNDGTDYADYLLSTETIYMIAVDSNNHKWIATKNSGLYHVNEDGTQLIERFTKDNSPLLHNEIYTVACDPHGNDVLIGTPDGMYVYSSTSSPAADDYSEVIAYPNPVRPDYTGWITIEGLMDNSLIKIADAQGNVVATGRSEGGMYIWDGCNSTGQRVRSGVYMVFASQTDGTNSNGAVTKIVVIN